MERTLAGNGNFEASDKAVAECFCPRKVPRKRSFEGRDSFVDGSLALEDSRTYKPARGSQLCSILYTQTSNTSGQVSMKGQRHLTIVIKLGTAMAYSKTAPNSTERDCQLTTLPSHCRNKLDRRREDP